MKIVTIICVGECLQIAMPCHLHLIHSFLTHSNYALCSNFKVVISLVLDLVKHRHEGYVQDLEPCPIQFFSDGHVSCPRRIGFQFWRHPGPFGQFGDLEGPTGRFLGFWTVLIQASYSYFGAEVPSVAGSEVINASEVCLFISATLLHRVVYW